MLNWVIAWIFPLADPKPKTLVSEVRAGCYSGAEKNNGLFAYNAAVRRGASKLQLLPYPGRAPCFKPYSCASVEEYKSPFNISVFW